MDYRAIIECNVPWCVTPDTVMFQHEGPIYPSHESTQSAVDEYLTHKCDHCGANDWSVLEVMAMRTDGRSHVTRN